MCFNCGCGMPDDDMGDPDNITNDTLKALGKKHGKNLHDTKHWVMDYLNNPDSEKNEEIEKMFKVAAKAWGQPVKEAKRLTLTLLNHEH